MSYYFNLPIRPDCSLLFWTGVSLATKHRVHFNRWKCKPWFLYSALSVALVCAKKRENLLCSSLAFMSGATASPTIILSNFKKAIGSQFVNLLFTLLVDGKTDENSFLPQWHTFHVTAIRSGSNNLRQPIETGTSNIKQKNYHYFITFSIKNKSGLQ